MEISVLAERSAAAMQRVEALIEPADLQKRAEPAEDPGVVLAVFKRLDSLIPRIHRSNLSARLKDGRTLPVALPHREVLALHLAVCELQTDSDRLARERRELEA